MHIAFQGATGAYSESAALRAWPGCTTEALERFEDVFEAVQAGRVTHGILPIENSVGGSIHRNYDLLLEHELPIVGETELTVVHNLLALPGTPIEAIRRVFSHPQALAQTERFVPHAARRRSRRDLRHRRQRAADPRRATCAIPRRSPRRGPPKPSASRSSERGSRTSQTTSRASFSCRAIRSRSDVPTRPRSPSRCTMPRARSSRR